MRDLRLPGESRVRSSHRLRSRFLHGNAHPIEPDADGGTLRGDLELLDDRVFDFRMVAPPVFGDPWKHGEKTDYEWMRISLDKAITARKKDRRAELLKSWADLAKLKEKSLELLKEMVGLGE